MIRVTDVIGATVVALVVVLVTGCAPTGGASSAPPSNAPPTTATPAESEVPRSLQTPTPAPTDDQVLAGADVVLITYGADGAGAFASGIVPDLVEPPGICTLTATSGDETRTATIDAVAATSSMNCGTIRISVPAGDWTIDLSYTSGSFDGSSGPVQVTVS